MYKKEYMTPELELIEVEMLNTLLTISTDNSDTDAGDVDDI